MKSISFAHFNLYPTISQRNPTSAIVNGLWLLVIGYWKNGFCPTPDIKHHFSGETEIGKVHLTLTGIPPLVAGFHRGIEFTMRTASLSRSVCKPLTTFTSRR